MGLRVPGRRASELAPKTALIEDPDLLDLAQRCFGANPVRPPASAARDSAPADPAAARTCIVTTMKNEGPFILEWLAHHRAIGVTDFLIYTNDCTDGTDRLLDLLAARGLVVHRDNPYRGSPLPPQHAALQAAESEPVLHSADWAICMDVDEFISIRLGDGRWELVTRHAAMWESGAYRYVLELDVPRHRVKVLEYLASREVQADGPQWRLQRGITFFRKELDIDAQQPKAAVQRTVREAG